MTASRTCPRCGTELTAFRPEGLCPHCLLLDAIEPALDVRSLASIPEAPPGRRIRYFGDYELLEELGHGGMGVVYKARQVSLNRPVAVKMVQGGEFANPKFVQRFRAEAEAIARVKHPNIVAVHEVGEHEGQHYFSMDYVEGPTLDELVRKGPLAPGRAARLVRTLAEAIHYAHQQGILHRDLKPSNVLVDLFDQPQITDFGLAKSLTGDSELTLSGQPLGTPGYMAPEQAAGKSSQVGPRSDVYALGAVLYHLLTGRAPFQAETLTDVLRQVRETDPVRPRLLNPSVPRDLEIIGLKCLEKEPGRRYESAEELAEELGRFVEAKPIVARPVGRAEVLWRWCRRQPVPASLAAALVFVVSVGFIVVTLQWKQAVGARRYAERLAYGADMNSAFRALHDNNLKEANRCLTNHWPKAGEPDLRGWEWRYLWQQCQGDELSTVTNYPGGALAVAFSHDGRWLASGGGREVKVWDLAAGGPVRSLDLGPDMDIQGLAFSPDGTRLAAGAWGGLLLWNTKNWHANRLMQGGLVNSLQFSPDGKRLVAMNQSEFVDWQLGMSDAQLPPLPIPYPTDNGQHACSFSAGGNTVAYATKRETPTLEAKVILRDLLNGVDRTVWQSRMQRVRTLVWSPNREWLVLARCAGAVEVLDISPGTESAQSGNATKNLDVSNVYALAISPDGRTLAAGGHDGGIEVYDTATWQKQQTLLGHRLWITDLAFCPGTNTSILASTSMDGTVRLWNTARKKRDDLLPLREMPRGWDPHWETAVFIEPDGGYSLGGIGGSSRTTRYPLPYASAERITAASVGPGGAETAFALQDGSVRLWSIAGQPRERCSIPSDALVDKLHYSSDGRLLFGLARDGATMWVWDANEGREIASKPNGWSRSWWYLPQFSADQKQLAIPIGEKGEVCLWDFAGSGEVLKFIGRHTDCNNVALSPDGETLASVNLAGTVKLWDVASRRETASLEGSGLPICTVVFSPGGDRLITASEGEIKVWDVGTRRVVADLGGEPNEGFCLLFRDAETLLVGTLKGVRQLHAPSFEEIEAMSRGQ